MLEEINIQNLGVIEKATIPFTPGLTVITGETGAGKTMLLTALGLLLGKKANTSVVRQTASFASVEGCWNIENIPGKEQIEETGAVIEDNQLYINRTVFADGKSRAVVGGKTTPLATLNTFTPNLVHIHGQADQMRLKNPNIQREQLDAFGGEPLQTALTEYQTVYREWRTLQKTIKEIQENMVAREREYEQLVYAVNEINTVQPEAGEDEKLTTEINLLMNTETIQQAVVEALGHLSTEDYTTTDLNTGIANVLNALNTIREFDSKLEEQAKLAETIQINIQELSSELSTYLTSIDEDAIHRLNEAQERLATLNGLMKRYGPTLNDVIKYWEEAELKATELNPETHNLDTLQAKEKALRANVLTLAGKLTKARNKAAKELSQKVDTELSGLAMNGSSFTIHIGETLPTLTGQDEVRFMLKTPATKDPQPIEKTASGGELSRIMLALELVVMNPEETATFVFDEVDSGIGGAVSLEIGKRLALLSQKAQVVVVSHLAQVAAFADNHLQVVKTLFDDDTISTTVNKLDDKGTLRELTRMLSGLTDSETGREHALELKTLADSFKQEH